MHANSKNPLREYDLTQPTAIIMGNEHSGVSEELFPLVDGEIYIPMFGMIYKALTFPLQQPSYSEKQADNAS